MTHREMAAVLKAVDLLACAACLFVLVAVIPDVEARGVVPAGATIGFAVGIAPLLALGARAWGLFSAIGHGETFTKENARRLRAMGYFAAADALVWLALIVIGVLVVDGLAFSVVASLSDRITVLARGQVLAEGDYATVSQDPRVVEAYIGSGGGHGHH